jgi:hypothetical protein
MLAEALSLPTSYSSTAHHSTSYHATSHHITSQRVMILLAESIARTVPQCVPPT